MSQCFILALLSHCVISFNVFLDELLVDFRYTFNFSKQEDQYVTRINLQSEPKFDDRDIEFTISCRGMADTNLTLYSCMYSGL